MTLRALVVDDEPLARELLVAMLDDLGDVEVAGEHGDGASAVEAIRRDRPDLVFLDIRMPELDGFEVLAALPPEERPAVIFVTAFDEHALQAFEVEAVDYLLKPFDEGRLEKAVDRVRRRHDRGKAATFDAERFQAILDRLDNTHHSVHAAGDASPRRLVVKEGERAHFVPLDDIDWLEADGKYVVVHVGERTHRVREALTRYAEDLAPQGFFRISRSAVVNVDRIREVQPWFHGDHVVILRNGDQVPTTRAFRGAVSEMLGRGRV